MRTKKIKLPEPMLVRALRERSPKGISALYDMYGAALFGVIARIIQEPQLSEDVLQETFIRIWQAIDQYDPAKGRLFTWMVNIARHMAIDRIRSKTYRNNAKTTSLEACDDLFYTVDLHNRLDYSAIQQIIMQLSPNEYRVIDLIYFKGYTHTEAAEMLKMPLGSVKTVLCRALRRLRSFYRLDMLAAS